MSYNRDQDELIHSITIESIDEKQRHGFKNWLRDLVKKFKESSIGQEMERHTQSSIKNAIESSSALLEKPQLDNQKTKVSIEKELESIRSTKLNNKKKERFVELEYERLRLDNQKSEADINQKNALTLQMTVDTVIKMPQFKEALDAIGININILDLVEGKGISIAISNQHEDTSNSIDEKNDTDLIA